MGQYKEKIDKIMGFIKKFSKENPGVMDGFMKMHKSASTPGALDTKTKELMGLAIGISLRCAGCIALHMAGALQAGATKEEIAETIGVAILMAGGPGVSYGEIAWEVFEELTGGK